METPLTALIVIVVIVLIVINLNIYHKIFQVTYFNLGRGLFLEIFYAWIIAMIEIGLIMTIGKWLFGAIFKILGIVGKIVLIVLALALIVFIIWKILQFVKGKKEKEEPSENNNEFIQIKQETNEDSKPEMEIENLKEKDDNVEAEENENLSAGIELTKADSNKVKENKVIRETMDTGLTEVKDLIDSSAKTLKKFSQEKVDNIKTKLETAASKGAKQNNIHMITCTNCGKMINEDAIFCNFCGNKIVKMDTVICGNCGNKITANVNFCHYCGEKIGKE